MNCKIYLENGICVDKLPLEFKKFYIREFLDIDFYDSKYYYPGDDIQYELDSACVTLYDKFQKCIFGNDDYYKLIDLLPMGIIEAGLNSDFNLPKERFEKYFSERLYKDILDDNDTILELDKLKYKYAYLADCQSLISTLQELIRGTNSNFIGFYKLLSEVKGTEDFVDDYYTISSDGRMAFGMLFSLIISLYSTFDILTKIVYELENLQDCSDKYKRMKSHSILYGNKKDLSLNNAEGTVFKKDRALNIIENLRNELIHNATWEMHPKIFFKMENGIVVDRCIYLPDFNEDGHLEKFINRKRFFSKGEKANEVLPGLYFLILQKILITINLILKTDFEKSEV